MTSKKTPCDEAVVADVVAAVADGVWRTSQDYHETKNSPILPLHPPPP